MIDFDELEEVEDSKPAADRATILEIDDEEEDATRDLTARLAAFFPDLLDDPPSDLKEPATSSTAPPLIEVAAVLKSAAKPSRRLVAGPDDMMVVVCHAIDANEITVPVKRNGTFKDLKKAIARYLRSDTILKRGRLVHRERGSYMAYQDRDRIAEVRHVLVMCTDLVVDEDADSIGDIASANEEEERLFQPPPRPTACRLSGSLAAFTKERALALQTELFKGFSQNDFLAELEALAVEHRDSPAAFIKARQKHLLKVQKSVLPKYGFEGTLAGVYKVMASCTPFIDDAEFADMATKINSLLGINSPKESWSKLTSALNSTDLALDVRPQMKNHTGRANIVAMCDPSPISSTNLSRLLASKSRPYGRMSAAQQGSDAGTEQLS